MAAAGASVTYLTSRQWEAGPDCPGIDVVAVCGRLRLYDGNGTRRTLPTLRFGFGLLRWLLQHRGDYDVLELASFPFWSVIAARVALAGTNVVILVDWLELWSAEYWRGYAGRVVGTVGHRIQQLALRLSPSVVVHSQANGRRIRALDPGKQVTVLRGLMPPPREPGADTDRHLPSAGGAGGPYILFTGRHVHDKGVDLLADTFVAVLKSLPGVRLVVTGDGPRREWLEAEFDRRGISASVDFLGFVPDDDLEGLVWSAACLLVPSRREGYGMSAVSGMAAGTPVVTAGFPENLAAEHIEPGLNGFVAEPPLPHVLAGAVIAVLEAGGPIRESTRAWYRRRAAFSTVDHSLEQMTEWHALRAAAPSAVEAPAACSA